MNIKTENNFENKLLAKGFGCYCKAIPFASFQNNRSEIWKYVQVDSNFVPKFFTRHLKENTVVSPK